MFTRLAVKREQFLWLVVDGMPGSHAYAKVYGEDKSKKVCEAAASRLLADVKVVARRQELIAAKAARQPLSSEFLSRELLAIAGEARALNQGSAAVAALMGIAKIQGLIIDRVASDVLVRKPSADPDSADEMTATQWLEQYGQKVIDHNSPEPLLTATDRSPDTNATLESVAVASGSSIDEDSEA